MNYLFYIERVANEKNKRGKARMEFRLQFSRSVVQSIMKALQRMKDEKDAKKYGKAGSHEAAENLAFMYSLYESCKMNNLNFGRYIEDILTRIKDGDKDYKSMLPCYYVEV